MSGASTIWCTSVQVTARDAALAPLAPSTLLTACQVASDILYAASGRRYPGLSSMVVRPTAKPSALTIREWSHYLQTLSGVGTSIAWATGGGWFGGGDATPNSTSIDLGCYPIRAVNVVKIDGVTIPANEYRIDDFRYLKRCLPTAASVPTERSGWPQYQNMQLPDSEPGTFSVDFDFGEDPPPGGVTAATTLATEFARMYSGSPNRLPARIQSISRQGVSFAMLDPMQFMDEGLTGLYDVDLWIRSINPGKQKFPATIWSPDMDTRLRAGTTYP